MSCPSERAHPLPEHAACTCSCFDAAQSSDAAASFKRMSNFALEAGHPLSPSSSLQSSFEISLPQPEHRVRMGRASFHSALHADVRVRGGQPVRGTSSALPCGSGGVETMTLSSSLQQAVSCPSPWNLARGLSPDQVSFLDASMTEHIPAGRPPGSDSGSYGYSTIPDSLSLLDYAEQMVLRNADSAAVSGSAGCQSAGSSNSLIKFADVQACRQMLLDDEGRRSC